MPLCDRYRSSSAVKLSSPSIFVIRLDCIERILRLEKVERFCESALDMSQAVPTSSVRILFFPSQSSSSRVSFSRCSMAC